MLDIAEEGFQTELQYSSILIQSGSYVKHFDLVFTRVFFDCQQIEFIVAFLSETNFFLNVSRREIKNVTLLLSALTPRCFQVSGGLELDFSTRAAPDGS